MTSDSKANVKHDVRNNERKKEKKNTHKILTEQDHTRTGTLPKGNECKNKIAYTTQNGKSKNIM